jgi:hypothetical protein
MRALRAVVVLIELAGITIAIPNLWLALVVRTGHGVTRAACWVLGGMFAVLIGEKILAWSRRERS